MTNVLKKAFTWSVVAVTIFWSVGFAAFAPMIAQAAECPELEAGDLWKTASKTAVYMQNEDGEALAFPNEKTFMSWGLDFADVVTLSNSCAEDIELAGFVPYAPGTLVYRDGFGTVYVVGINGAITPFADYAALDAVFGANAVAKARMVGDSHWLAAYDNTGDELDGEMLPDGIFVKTSASSDVYFVLDGMLYDVEGAVPAPWMVVTVSSDLLDSVEMADESMTASEIAAMAVDEVLMGSMDEDEDGETPVVAGALTVSLAGSTPDTALVPRNGVSVPFTTFNLRAGSSAVTVDTVTVKRGGLSDSDDYTVWIERDGARVSNRQASHTSDVFTLTFSPALTIGANQTVSLDLVATLDDAAGTGNLAVTGVTAGTATVSGGLPIVGNTMSFADYEVAEFTFDPSTATTTVAAGETDIELASFDLEIGTRDGEFRSIVLRNNGNEDMSRTLSDLRLEHNGDVVSTDGVVSGRYVTFNLKNGGFEMEADEPYTFKVVGSVVTKEKTTSPSLTFALHRAEDLSVVEKNTGFGANLDDTAPVEMNNVVFTSGVVTVSKKATSPANTNVVKGAKNVLALVANVKADEEITSESFTLNATGDYSSFDNVKVTLNGTSLGTMVAASSMEFDSSFTLKKGDNELRVYVDADSTGDIEGDDIYFTVGSEFLYLPEYVQSGNPVDEDDISASVTGATIEILGAELSLVRNDGYTASREIVVGAENNVLARFNLKALNDDIKITSIVVTPSTTSGQIDASAVSGMEVYIGGTQVGTTRDYTNSGATFSSLNYSVGKDVTKPLEVRADFDSSTTGTIRFTVTINYQDSRGKVPTDSPVSQSSQVTTVVSTGSLTANIDASTPEADIMLAKAGVEQTLAVFKLSSLKDTSEVTELVFENTTTSIDFMINEYRLYKGTTLVGTANPFEGESTFTFNDGQLTVAANANQLITLKVVLNAIDEADKSGGELGVVLVEGTYETSAGAEEALTIDSDASDVMVVRQARPTFSNVALSTDGAGSTLEEVLKFTITAEGGADVKITDLVFEVSGSGAASTTDFRLYEGTTQEGGTTSTPEWSGLDITVAAGTTKTFVVKADTSDVAVDARVGLTLDRGTSGANITWSEVFVDGDNTGISGEYLNNFPVSHTKRF